MAKRINRRTHSWNDYVLQKYGPKGSRTRQKFRTQGRIWLWKRSGWKNISQFFRRFFRASGPQRPPYPPPMTGFEGVVVSHIDGELKVKVRGKEYFAIQDDAFILHPGDPITVTGTTGEPYTLRVAKVP